MFAGVGCSAGRGGSRCLVGWIGVFAGVGCSTGQGGSQCGWVATPVWGREGYTAFYSYLVRNEHRLQNKRAGIF